MTTNSESAPWNRVLVVDDDPDVQTLISVALGQGNGYQVEVCGSSVEAVPRARQFDPDVILLDVMMPGADGPTTLKSLRSDAATAHIPVVFISASIDRNPGGQYKEMGALGAIPKPFDPAALPATLERIRSGAPLKPAFPAELQDLRGHYGTELAGRLQAMEALGRTLVADGWSRPAVEELFALAHRMAGSAGLFGLDAVATAAGVLESLLKRLLDDPRWPPARPPAEVMTLVRAVAAAAPRHAPPAGPRRRTRPNSPKP